MTAAVGPNVLFSIGKTEVLVGGEDEGRIDGVQSGGHDANHLADLELVARLAHAPDEQLVEVRDGHRVHHRCRFASRMGHIK